MALPSAVERTAERKSVNAVKGIDINISDDSENVYTIPEKVMPNVNMRANTRNMTHRLLAISERTFFSSIRLGEPPPS